MLKHYELIEIIKGLISDLSIIEKGESEAPFIYSDHEQLSHNELIVNLVEDLGDCEFENNKYKITVEYIHSEHEDYDKIDDFFIK